MDYQPTISELILSHLMSAKSSYRQKKILWEMIKKRNNFSKQNYYQGVHRLSKRGLIREKDNGYFLTPKGKSENINLHRPIRQKIKKTKRIIVIFDVPETKKRTREWLREQLKWWNFKMIQKSVWVGDGPLPPEFKERLKNLGIGKSVLTFTIRKESTK